MLCIFNHITDPAFNLAAEEFILKNIPEDVFRLWRNDNSIIVGKHQNSLAEINHNFVQQNNIKVFRRVSGGGAVYHDKGNLNFSFFMKGERDKLIDFKRYTSPIISALSTLGVTAKFEGKNNLTVNGLKISGNAEHIFKNRVLHHGTLLFESNLDVLASALNSRSENFTDKSVKSIRSSVTNISDHINIDIDIMALADILMKHIKNIFPNSVDHQFSKQDIELINRLKSDKYDTWEWNYGYSPFYNYHRKIKTNSGIIEVSLKVDKGIIIDIEIKSESICKADLIRIEERIRGNKHNYEIISKVMESVKRDGYPDTVNHEDILRVLF